MMVHGEGHLLRLSGIQRTVCVAISLFIGESGHRSTWDLTGVATAPNGVAKQLVCQWRGCRWKCFQLRISAK